MRRIPVLLAVLALAAPGVASGAVRNAESILPPGQSGFVKDAAAGTGSPHLYDQFPLYVSFRWKSAAFNQPGTTEQPKPGVTIVRDAYGVPSITAASDPDAWWGAGYAVAQDRLTELELFRRQAAGRLAEVFGESYLDDDLLARRDFYTPAELDAQLAKLPAGLRARIDAYRDGVNAWIQHVRDNPDDLPAEFKLFKVALTDWTARDTAGIGVLLARTVPSGIGQELPNARALKSAGARAFDSLLPLHVPGQPVTVPRGEGAFPSQPGRTRAQERAGFRRSRRLIAKLTLPPAPAQDPRGRRAAPIAPAGSMAVAVGRKGRGFLYSGPQEGFSFPELFVELEVHAPGLDVRGATAPGVPVIAVGHNGHVSWAVTSGESDDDDLYAEQLAGGDESYTYRGDARAMSCRDETFAYSSSAGPQSRTERICRTRHGPVQARAGDTAYARRYAIWGRELETFVGLEALNRAKDVGDVDDAVADMTWTENVTAADEDGHVGFWLPGLLPLKPRTWDERLLYPGTGEAEWRGFLPQRQHPHVIDPKQGWLANWNNQPSAAWTNGDLQSRPRGAGPFHRAHFLFALTRRFAAKPSLARLEALVRSAGTTVQQRSLASDLIASALRGASGPARTVLRTIRAWDGSYAKTDSAGTVDPGVAAWEAFKAAALEIDLKRLGRGSEELAGVNAEFHVFDITNGPAHALRTLGLADLRRAAATAGAALTKTFGTSDASRWRQPRRMAPWTLQGAGQPPALPFFDRGTWEQLVELG